MAVVANLDVLLSANTTKFDAGMKRSQTALRSLGSAAGALGVTLGGAALFGAAVQGTRDFQSAMAKSTSILSGVTDEMRAKMEETAFEIAKTTKFSAAEAAESYFFLASAGLDAAAAIEALPTVSKFAQAGLFDMALATDLLTDAQSALGLTVKDTQKNIENMKRVSDVLVKANTLANASVQQFSEALTNKAGAAMRQLGIDVEEGVAVLAAFADQGPKGAEAGTQLAIVLRDLTTKALENKEAFKTAGVAVFDASGEFRNVADIIRDLDDALVGMSDAEKKTQLLGLGFTDKSAAAIATLSGTSEKIREYEASLRDVKGITDEIAGKSVPAFELAMSSLQASFTELSNSVIAPLLVELAGVVKSFSDAAKAIDDFAAKQVARAGKEGTLIQGLNGARERTFLERLVSPFAIPAPGRQFQTAPLPARKDPTSADSLAEQRKQSDLLKDISRGVRDIRVPRLAEALL